MFNETFTRGVVAQQAVFLTDNVVYKLRQ